MKRKIIAVLGDIGSCRETVPALKILKMRGYDIEVVLDAHPQSKAGTVLPSEFGTAAVGRLPSEADVLSTIVVGTSATATDAQNAWTSFGRSHHIPVVWVEDLYGTGEWEKVRASGGPDTLCVIDDAAAEIARPVWPKAVITVCGKPTFARLGTLIDEQPRIRRAVRSQLGLEGSQKLLTFFSGASSVYEMQTVDGLYELRGRRGLRMAIRLHPKLETFDQTSIKGRLAQWPSGALTDPKISYEIGAEELTVASDIVVCTWGSTQGYAAVLARVATVIVMFHPREELAVLGYPDGLPPHVAHHAALPAFSTADVTNVVTAVLAGRTQGAHVISAANVPFRSLIAPGAAERIADAIMAAKS